MFRWLVLRDWLATTFSLFYKNVTRVVATMGRLVMFRLRFVFRDWLGIVFLIL